MLNDYKENVKGFRQLSRAWYGNASLNLNNEIIDEVTFGFYTLKGALNGELTMKWKVINNQLTPVLNAYDDSWIILSKLHDIIDILAIYNNKNITPTQFCTLLLENGFIDMTEMSNVD